VLTTLAQDVQYKSGPTLGSGRYSPTAGMIFAPEQFLGTGTYLHDNPASGRHFTKSSGTADDNYRMPIYDVPAIFCNDGSAGGGYDLLADDSFDTGIETATIALMAGPCPPAVIATSDNCYKRIELAAGQARNIEILFAFAQPVRVRFTEDSGATWKNVEQEKGATPADLHFAKSDVVAVYIKPIKTKGLCIIETSEGHQFRVQPSDTWTQNNPQGTWLPSTGRIRLHGQNGWASFAYMPTRGGSIEVERVHKIGYDHPQAAAAWVSPGLMSHQDGQTYSHTVTPADGNIGWTSQGSLDDAGEGLGSFEPFRWAASQLIVPPDFTDGVTDGLNSITTVFLRLSGVTVEHQLDDNRRMFGSVLTDIVANNDGNQYIGAAGNLACVVSTSNDGGATLIKHGEYIVGIGEDGFCYENPSAGINDLKAMGVDRMVFLGGSSEEPVISGIEVVQDGWAAFSGIRYWAHRGGIHDRYLGLLPDAQSTDGIYVPPGAPGTNAPYGKAGDDYAGHWPILPEGTGDQPITVWPATTSPISALQSIVQDLAEVVYDFGTPVRLAPYYMGFDADSNLIIEPFDPDSQQPVYGFTDRNSFDAQDAYPEVAWITIPSNLRVTNSITNLRGELTAAGQDWITNELLIEHRDNGPSVKEAIGYNRSCYIQSERWGDQGYLSGVADGIQVLTSLPTQIASATLPHLPQLRMGQSVLIWHAYTGLIPAKFYITRARHRAYDGASPILDTYFVARRQTGA